jgi:hypothetical protein
MKVSLSFLSGLPCGSYSAYTKLVVKMGEDSREILELRFFALASA